MRGRFYLAACLLRGPQAGAANLDCAKASWPVDRLMCGAGALSTAVEMPADADAVATALGPQIIRADQRAWTTRCDKLAKAVDLVAADADGTAGNRRAGRWRATSPKARPGRPVCPFPRRQRTSPARCAH
jgi:hypothetical protein